MDSKPPIDLERLKELQDKVKEPIEKRPLPHPSLTDPYYSRRHLIRIEDFDEWP